MDFINVLTIIITVIALFGAYNASEKIRESIEAEKRLREIIEENHKLKKEIIGNFKILLEKGNEKELSLIEKKLKQEIQKLENDRQKERMLDILDNNTEIGKKRFINAFVTSL